MCRSWHILSNILLFTSNLSLESKMMEEQNEIQTLEESREDLDNFGYNLMDCSSCLLVKMGEKANYSGMCCGRYLIRGEGRGGQSLTFNILI